MLDNGINGLRIATAVIDPRVTSPAGPVWLTCCGSPTLRASRRVDEVIALSGLRSAARRKAGEIFDEPYNGTDPEGIVWMKGFHRWRRRAARCWSPAT